jgi:hypothetical protein
LTSAYGTAGSYYRRSDVAAGRGLVNGSAAGLVVLTIDPPAHARVLGIPVTVRELVVIVTEPDALVSELQRPPR